MRRVVTQRCVRFLYASARSFAAFLTMTTIALAGGAPIAGTGGDTGEKPQSKLWFADQSWWAVITREGRGLHFYEFVNGAWAPCAFIGAEISSGGRADVLWTGEELFVLAYAANTKLFKYTYDRTLRTWNLVPGFPAKVPNGAGSETMVLDIDTTGRLWVTYESGNSIWVAWTTSLDHTLWSQPLALRDGVDSDDITAVVAFDARIGVFWSDQVRDEFGFRVHHDTDPAELWDAVEIADSGSGHADDHICMKSSHNGTVYVLTKDDFDKMTLHRRNPLTGAWTTKSGVISGTGTRGSLMLSDDDARIYVPYTDWESSPNKIKLRRAPYSTLSFKTEVSDLISGTTMNDPSGTKQVLPAGVLMCLAHGGGAIWWNGWGILPPDGPPPPPAPAFPAAQLVLIPRPAPGFAEIELNLPLDERSGTTARDATANAHIGSLAGEGSKAPPSWIAGYSGGGLQLTGSSFVRFESTRDLEIAGSFTVEAWVRRRAGVTSIGTIVSKGLSQARNYQLQLLANGSIDFKWELANGDNRGTTSTRSLTAGTWQHVACVYDQAAGKSSIYIDGKLDRTASTTGTPAATHEPLYLGVRISGSARKEFLAADIDGVRVWRGVAYQSAFTPGPMPSVRQADPEKSVIVSWQPPAGEVRPVTYTLAYRIDGGAGPFVLASGLTGTTWTHRNPQLGRLCYEVRATTVEDGRTGPAAVACVESLFEPADPKTPTPRDAAAAKAGAALQAGLTATPNPFNPRTLLLLSAPQAGPATVAIYDVTGRLVRELHRGWLEPGVHEFGFDANAPPQPLASGVYFLRADIPGQRLRERLVLLK